MKTFVTGSTGLLGSNLVKQLLEQGHSVTALVRSPEKATRQLGQHANLRVMQGDIENVAGFAPALAGHDVLFHTAAYFRESFASGDHWPKLVKLNVDATLALLDAAERHGLRKVIYVSSSGVVGEAPAGQPRDEQTPLAEHSPNPYFRSKVLAEQRVSAWQKAHSLPVVMILPTWMHGPQDAAPTAAGRLVHDLLAGKLPATMPGGTSVVDARDVAQAMITAVDKGRAGERYIISNSYKSLRDIAAIVSTIGGVPAPTMHMPYPMALLVGWTMQTIAALTGGEALLTVSAVRTMNAADRVSGAKAVRELGIQPRPFEDTLRDSVAWVRAHAMA